MDLTVVVKLLKCYMPGQRSLETKRACEAKRKRHSYKWLELNCTKMKLIPKEELINSLEDIIEDAEFKVKHAKSPSSKRNTRHALNFYKSIKHHLNEK